MKSKMTCRDFWAVKKNCRYAECKRGEKGLRRSGKLVDSFLMLCGRFELFNSCCPVFFVFLFFVLFFFFFFFFFLNVSKCCCSC